MFTAETKIPDQSACAALVAIGLLWGRLMHRLFVDRYVRGHSESECKKLYIARYGLTARQFNALARELRGKLSAAEAARKHRIEVLREQIAATEKTIGRLQKQDKVLSSGKGRIAKLKPHEQAQRRKRIRFRLHQKKRRLGTLRLRLLRRRTGQRTRMPGPGLRQQSADPS